MKGVWKASGPHKAFELRVPSRQAGPVIVASPHSGSDYEPAFLAACRLDLATLRRSEDSFVNELFAAAPSLGAPLLAARFPRAYCDVNREKWELDPTMFSDTLPHWVNTTSPRVSAGLGTIARFAANGEAIYGTRLAFAEAEHRARACWQPYHDTLAALIDDTRARYGVALLLDCHSMPAHATTGRRPVPNIVLGDAHGWSCAAEAVGETEAWFLAQGYQVGRNDPYAGGYVTRHYGRPRDGVHALQLEIARSLYMDEQRGTKTAGFARVARDMEAFVAFLVQRAHVWFPAARDLRAAE